MLWFGHYIPGTRRHWRRLRLMTPENMLPQRQRQEERRWSEMQHSICKILTEFGLSVGRVQIERKISIWYALVLANQSSQTYPHGGQWFDFCWWQNEMLSSVGSVIYSRSRPLCTPAYFCRQLLNFCWWLLRWILLLYLCCIHNCAQLIFI